LLLGLVAAILVHHLAIRREEIHLAKRFGDEWRKYSTRTPRWLF
jgi:protein-S-isoprenylcysteine O-methyltransferase Ste14